METWRGDAGQERNIETYIVCGFNRVASVFVTLRGWVTCKGLGSLRSGHDGMLHDTAAHDDNLTGRPGARPLCAPHDDDGEDDDEEPALADLH